MGVGKNGEWFYLLNKNTGGCGYTQDCSSENHAISGQSHQKTAWEKTSIRLITEQIGEQSAWSFFTFSSIWLLLFPSTCLLLHVYAFLSVLSLRSIKRGKKWKLPKKNLEHYKYITYYINLCFFCKCMYKVFNYYYFK